MANHWVVTSAQKKVSLATQPGIWSLIRTIMAPLSVDGMIQTTNCIMKLAGFWVRLVVWPFAVDDHTL